MYEQGHGCQLHPAASYSSTLLPIRVQSQHWEVALAFDQLQLGMSDIHYLAINPSCTATRSFLRLSLQQ